MVMLHHVRVVERHYEPGQLTSDDRVVFTGTWESLALALLALAAQVATYEQIGGHLARTPCGMRTVFWELEWGINAPKAEGDPTLHTVEISISYDPQYNPWRNDGPQFRTLDRGNHPG